jgi:hypothetical protein
MKSRMLALTISFNHLLLKNIQAELILEVRVPRMRQPNLVGNVVFRRPPFWLRDPLDY